MGWIIEQLHGATSGCSRGAVAKADAIGEQQPKQTQLGSSSEYSVRDGVLGLTVYHRNATWTPVEPSPVDSRLRTKSRFKYPTSTIE